MSGLYIHIPFCKSRCIYCDFYSDTRGRTRQAAFVEALCRELTLRRDYLPTRRLDTIYLGGGTPSQLTIQQLTRIYECVYQVYEVSAEAEVTFEANPDDLTPDYLKALRTLPINRMSLGVQTFDDDELRLLNRRHSAAQAARAVQDCVEAGFTNLSIDLIYGLPNQTLEDWERNLRRALALPVTHLSAYALIYEPGTALWRIREAGKVAEADDELSLAMFERLIDRAKKQGFEHYETSNFALQGFRSRHNSSYWHGVPYLGCGPSAHSFDGVNRRYNTPDVEAYIKNGGDTDGEVDGRPLSTTEVLTLNERYNDYVLTRLRTSDGLKAESLSDHFGKDLRGYMLRMARPYLESGHLAMSDSGVLTLTHKGLFISDTIFADLMRVDE